MKLVIRGSQIDITLCPLNLRESSTYINNINKRYEEEKNDPILGYIINDAFYKLGSSVAQDHYSLQFARNYKDKFFWVVLNKHPFKIYDPMVYISECDIFNTEEFDIWSDERSNSLIAVITAVDCD